jgi:RNA polymerase sigma-70 factor (ECF subfamily)
VQDLDLIRQAAGGDRTAFQALVERHQASVLRLARAITRDAGDAEDVLQETFLAAFRALEGFRGEASVRTWLMTITRNTAQRLGRRRSGSPAFLEPLSELGIQAGWGDPERHTEQQQDRASLLRAMDRLTEEEREILVLRELEEIPGDEVAGLLGLSLPAMKSRLHRARLRFAAAVRAQGGDHGS